MSRKSKRKRYRDKNIREAAKEYKWKIREQEKRCYMCDLHLYGHKKTIDHFIPICHGGKSNFENLRLCCEKCNTAKNSYILQRCTLCRKTTRIPKEKYCRKCQCLTSLLPTMQIF